MSTSARHRIPLGLVAAFALVLGLVGPAPLRADEHTHTSWDTTIESSDGTVLHATIYRPAGATAESPVPMILHSHGWGGTRTSSPGAFGTELDRGFGVLSFDQRGHGQTGGTAYVQDPEREGRDVIAVLDHAASLDWVLKELDDEEDEDEEARRSLPDRAADRAREQARGLLGGNGDEEDGEGAGTEDGETDLEVEGTDAAGDPVVFAMGGSYGGGYQLVGALTEIREHGATRVDALAPEITWYDLAASLAPEKVTRTAWVTLLYAAGLDMHAEDIHVALGFGAATGQWPDGTYPGVPNIQDRFWENGPVAFVERDGLQLDIPALIGQGATDNLFNLNEGWKNFERTLTDEARERSVFIGYNGGHALPNVLPAGDPFDVQLGGNVDACSPDGFGTLRLDFFDAVMAGEDPRDLVGGYAYSLMTAGGECVQRDSLDDHLEIETGLDALIGRVSITPSGVGAAQHIELAEGPVTVAGVPFLEADVSSFGLDQRVFVALSVGSDPVTARVVQNNMMPLRELTPVLQERRSIELPGVAVDVPEGQNLYLTISPISDMSFGHGSTRTPGAVVLEDLTVLLPVLE